LNCQNGIWNRLISSNEVQRLELPLQELEPAPQLRSKLFGLLG
jgi:hypothetical protein